MTSGGQCAMMAGAPLMPLWSASNWDMQPLEVSLNICKLELHWLFCPSLNYILYTYCSGGVAYSNAFFGAGTGPIYLDDVACTSSASQLLECSSRPILTHNCQHSADAGVGCKGNFKCFSNAKRILL